VKVITHLAQVDGDRCTGDKLCEGMCLTGAIKVVAKKATVDERLCVACRKCMDVCREAAVSIAPRTRALTLGTDFSGLDPAAIDDLCDRAHLDPEEFICRCSFTSVKEAAAAVLKGARSPDDVTLMTGARSRCGMYCISPILRLLNAHNADLTPLEGRGWYNVKVNMWDIPSEVARKYPEYYLEEDREREKTMSSAL
jgi:Fe-S-cluster-containing hydrogenase component 2